ncbi:4Fe-4S binding protein [Persephonella sp.]
MNQLRVSLNFHNCTHVYFRNSSCDKCLKVCPIEDAISFDNGRLEINEEKCINCGACFGICPTEAFSINGFFPDKLLDQISNAESPVISCKLNVPCIASLDPQYLISFVLFLKKDISLDISSCDSCSISILKERIINITRESNSFLEDIGVEEKVLLEDKSLWTEIPEIRNRRRFLKDFGKISAGLIFWTLVPEIDIEAQKEDEYKNIVEEKIIPEKRQFLIRALKDLDTDPEELFIKTDKLSFCSDKKIDNDLCTNCSICYNICPTGALKPGRDRLQILFEPLVCVKCGICIEACPENCLDSEKKINLNTFLNGMKVLAEHVMIPCEECLVPFSYKGDSTICPRCRQLDDELKDLLGID